ncbi:19438_t:CDS:2 [Entrophospora sp. SA101]|nr:19438_t:CDS:2 [Entrophospora sp. SA101]
MNLGRLILLLWYCIYNNKAVNHYGFTVLQFMAFMDNNMLCYITTLFLPGNSERQEA